MKIVGKTKPIHDAVGKASGQTRYVGDMTLPRMTYAAVVLSSIPHGMVTKIDTEQAMAVHGVLCVLHCLEEQGNVYNRYRSIKGQKAEPQEYVFNKHVRFVGDRVGCVVAETQEAAIKAAKLVKVTYDEYPFAVNVEETLAGKIPNVHDKGAVYGDLEVEVGDSKAIEGAISVSTATRLARINHVTMETHAAIASFDATLDQLTIWSPNQSVHAIRTNVADTFNLPYHKVRVVKTTMGGSFGAKQEWVLEPVVAAATLRVKRPVKLVYSRKEAFTSTVSRSPMVFKMQSHFSKDGMLKGMVADVSIDAGGYLGNTWDYCNAMANKFFRCYSYPYMRFSARAVITNTPVSGAFRGWTSPELAVAFEHNLNMAARKLAIDPYEMRLKNAAKPGELDPRINVSMAEVRMKEALQKGCQLFDWYEKKKAAASFNKANTRRKRGVAVGCGGHLNGYYPKLNDFAEVIMRMTEDGKVIAHISLHDHGCGTVTAFRMIIADALGIEYDDVLVGEGDTSHTPFDYGCFSSRTTYVLGAASYACAISMLDRLKCVAAELYDHDKALLYTEDGFVKHSEDKTVAYSFAQLSLASMWQLKKEVSVKEQYINEANPGVTGAHFAHVEVDTYTGMVTMLDYTAVHDIGQAINREICVAQVQGAVLMGAGAAIYEDAGTNTKGTSVDSLKDYHLVNAFEAPNIIVDFIEDGDPVGPFGAKSIGETSHVPVAGTIVGAINDALQTDFCDIPITPDKIAALMQERSERHRA